MEEVVLRMRVPEDLARDLRGIPEEDWSILVGKVLRDKIKRIEALEKASEKSALTEEGAARISGRIDARLAERYEKLMQEVLRK